MKKKHNLSIINVLKSIIGDIVLFFFYKFLLLLYRISLFISEEILISTAAKEGWHNSTFLYNA